MSQRQGPRPTPPQKRRRLGPQVTPSIPFANSEDLPTASPQQHYQMSGSTQYPIELSTWLGDNEDDPALEVHFNPLLCTFLHFYPFRRDFLIT